MSNDTRRLLDAGSTKGRRNPDKGVTMAKPGRPLNVFGPGPHWRSVAVDGDEVASTTPCCDTEVRVPVREMEVLGEVTVNCPGDGRLWLFRWDPWRSLRQGAWID